MSCNQEAKDSEYFGVWVVRGAFLLAIFGWGVGFYGPPIYIYAVQKQTTWPLSIVASAATLHFLFGAYVITYLPRLHKRFGIAPVTATGAALTAFGVTGWAYATELWHLTVAAILSGAGWVTMGAAGINAIISPWYSRTRSQALAKAYNGASLGGVLFSPLWVFLISWLGFKMAAISVGCLMFLTVLMLATQMFSRRPSEEEVQGEQFFDNKNNVKHNPSSPPIHSLWSDRRFLTLAAGMAVGLFAQIGLIAHLFSLLVPILGKQQAGFAMGFITFCAIAGRSLIFAIIPIDTNRRLYAVIGYLIQIFGIFIVMFFIASHVWMIWLGVALFGLGVGNATSLPPLIAQAEFPEKDVARVVALIISISQATYAFAPMIFGLILEITTRSIDGVQIKNINQFFISAMLIQIIAIGFFLYGKKEQV